MGSPPLESHMPSPNKAPSSGIHCGTALTPRVLYQACTLSPCPHSQTTHKEPFLLRPMRVSAQGEIGSHSGQEASTSGKVCRWSWAVSRPPCGGFEAGPAGGTSPSTGLVLFGVVLAPEFLPPSALRGLSPAVELNPLGNPTPDRFVRRHTREL